MALQGPIPVEFGQVFPDGVYAAGGFEPVRDFDASSNGRFVQSKDKASGLPLWVVEVIDADQRRVPARSRSRSRRRFSRCCRRARRGAVRAGGVHRADGHPVRDPGRKARLLAQGVRGSPAGPSARPSPGLTAGRRRHEQRGRVVLAPDVTTSVLTGTSGAVDLRGHDADLVGGRAGRRRSPSRPGAATPTTAAVEFARALAHEAQEFADEIERMHAAQTPPTTTAQQQGRWRRWRPDQQWAGRLEFAPPAAPGFSPDQRI